MKDKEPTLDQLIREKQNDEIIKSLQDIVLGIKDSKNQDAVVSLLKSNQSLLTELISQIKKNEQSLSNSENISYICKAIESLKENMGRVESSAKCPEKWVFSIKRDANLLINQVTAVAE